MLNWVKFVLVGIILFLVIYSCVISNKLIKTEADLTISESNNASLKSQLDIQNKDISSLINNINDFKSKKSEINIARKEAIDELSKVEPDNLINIFNNRLLSISNKTY